ncbi:hypothetical protein EBX93_13125, partial [bacterium]|nr:hypothetical protein [bacterium]
FSDLQLMRRNGTGLVSLSLGFMMLAVPFVLTVGKLTTKPTGQKILEKMSLAPVENDNRLAMVSTSEVGHLPLFASWWEGEDKSPAARFAWSFMVLGDSYLKGLNYLGCAFALIGLFSTPINVWGKPGVMVVVLSFLILNVAFYRVALVMGYLSERHAVLALMLMVIWSAYGGIVLGNWFLALFGRDMNSKPGDPVEDPFCWSHYYAGKVFLEGAMDLRFSEPRVKYVIVERSGNPHLRLNTQDEESLKAQQGKVVYDWACKRKGVHSTVVVYEIPVR